MYYQNILSVRKLTLLEENYKEAVHYLEKYPKKDVVPKTELPYSKRIQREEI